ncbi:AAA family ATPase [Vreelandella rituensis]|uniref:GTP-binding protein n=1 Tax=Vreelandella rituensis TaxID=2282306 RepID=A0A368U0Q3_9GAMM|nr:AAA family ATPase [Halomonas rituensis]RCV90699.1 GTP-binding protein [Halomonas rituensis]
MKLKRIRIEQLRQFQNPLVVDDLQPGINVITGPNESGKSTIASAIRAAFFERHRSSSVSDLQPWGDSSAAPQVMLEFDWQDRHWRLEKRFLGRKRCDLEIAGVHYSGDDAEEQLAELLGFQHPARGASKAEHWGIPGLLWIEQGAGHELRPAVEHAADHLQSALGAGLGEVTSSGGDEIIQAVATQKAVFLTATGKPRGEFAKLPGQIAQQREELAGLEARIASYRQEVDRLSELRKQHAMDAREKPWQMLRQQQQAAEKALANVETLQQAQAVDRQALQSCQNTLVLLREQLEVFQRQQQTLLQRQSAAQHAQETLQALREGETEIDVKHQLAEKNYRQARLIEQQARQQEQLSRLRQELERLSQERVALDDRLEKAYRVQAELLAQRRALPRQRIDEPTLEKLRKQHKQRDDLEIRLQSIATRVQYNILPDQAIELDGQALSMQGEILLLESGEVTIPGVGHLRIIPGGEDIGELSRRQRQLEDVLKALFEQLELTSLEEVERRVEAHQRLDIEIQANERLLSSLAPKGIDLLSQACETCKQQCETLSAQCRSQTALAEQAPSLVDAEAQRTTAEQALKLAEKRQADHQLALNGARRDAANSDVELQRLQAELSAPDRQQRERELSQQLVEQRAEYASLEQRIANRQQRIDAAQPALLQQDVQRFARSAEQLEKAAHDRELALTELHSRLEAHSAEGLEEQRAECLLLCEQLGRRFVEMERRVAALSLLDTLLKEKRHALTQRLQAPLQRHLNHYLALLFPQASLSVDENLIPTQLTRTQTFGMERGTLETLSFGAREQMGLISRLAYADLLREAGRPTLIILDDALVHSDAQRLAQMKRILFDAAERHQVLLFSCHPEDWRDLGVAPRDMQALKAVSDA